MMLLFQGTASRLLVNELVEKPRSTEISIEDTDSESLVSLQPVVLSCLLSFVLLQCGKYEVVETEGNDVVFV